MKSEDLCHLICPLSRPLSSPSGFSVTHLFPPPPPQPTLVLILLSHALTLSSLSPQTGPAVQQHPPPPLPSTPPAVCPPWTRIPTTIQVTGQEKEQAALTIDQWRPLKQSFPILQWPFCTSCKNWKRQTFGEVAEKRRERGQEPSWTTAYKALFSFAQLSQRSTRINTLVHTITYHSVSAPCSLFLSRAILSFNTIIKVKTKPVVIRWLIKMCWELSYWGII